MKLFTTFLLLLAAVTVFSSDNPFDWLPKPYGGESAYQAVDWRWDGEGHGNGDSSVEWMASHYYSIVDGRAYLFGGSLYGPMQPAIQIQQTPIPNGKIRNLVIPSSIDGCPVVYIASGDYYADVLVSGFYSSQGQVWETLPLSISLPDTLKIIGYKAFFCSAARSISIPSDVEVIGEAAFRSSYLTSISIPNSVTTIGPYAFYNSDLKSATIGSGVKTIPRNAFGLCASLSFVSIPNSVTTIEEAAFSGCTNLTSVTIPRTVTTIGNGAFESCRSLTSIALPSGLTTINPRLLCDCSGLTSVTIPDSVTNIGNYAFSGCSGLTSITIPNSVADIETTDTFRCGGLKWVRLPPRFSGNQTLIDHIKRWNPDCTVVFGTPVRLSVVSGIAATTPAAGETISWIGASVTCSASSPHPDPQSPGYRYVCSGWSGTGDVPTTGSTTSCSFEMSRDSSIHWNWTTNILISCQITGVVEPKSVSQWQQIGDVLSISVGADDPSGTEAIFSGDSDGVVFDAVANAIVVPADRPRTFDVQIMPSGRVFAAKPLPLLSGGDTEWFGVEDEMAQDGFSLRSGEIDQGETSTLEMSIQGAGEFSFDWRISANRSDWAYFIVDGAVATNITRIADWSTVSTNFTGGTHTLRWVFDRHASATANEEAAFLDNISWKPEVSLAICSEYGHPTPAVGTSTFLYGTQVSASAPTVESDGIRHVCVGWSGSGSVPGDTGSNALQFHLWSDSTISWRWRTDYWIDVAVTKGGSTSFLPCWVENGQTVSVRLSPDYHLHRISFSGDIDGVSAEGPMLQFVADKPRTIRVAIDETKPSLYVVSAHGSPIPAVGTVYRSWGETVEVSVLDPEPESGYQYLCSGWHGTGSVPPEGRMTNATIRLEEDSSIEWLWTTNVWISLETDGAIVADFSGAWSEIGKSVVVPYAPLADYVSFAIGGDADGVAIDERAQTITILADRPRSVSVTATAMSLASALDAKGLVWTTSGGDIWIPQRVVSSDGADAAASGDATGGDILLETSVLGAGTLSWFWKMNASGWAGVDASVDGRDVAYLETSGDWTSASTQISGEGAHAVRFAFWTEEGGTSSDRAYLDRVSWTGATIPRATQTTPEAVPYAWLDRWPGLLADNGGDYERAAAAIAANGINTVWECYVAGLDPTDPSAVFRVNISMDGDEPRIDWTPDLGASRDYRLEGRTEFGDIDGWKSPVTDDHRFFRARVALLDASGSVEEDDAFPGFVTVTFDANGGTIETKSKDYTATGTLGTLPVPSWNDIPFLGWYSAPTGGVRITQQTPVPYRDTRVYAHWNCHLVHLDSNGGSGEMEDFPAMIGVGTSIPANRFSRIGYTFSGWSWSNDNNPVFSDFGQLVLSPENINSCVLYACWSANEYNVQFVANGGTGEMANQNLEFDKTETLSLNRFECGDKVFAGWALSPDGEVVYRDGELVNSLVVEGSISLFAKWMNSPLYIIVDVSEGAEDSARYHVSGLNEMPANGWQDELAKSRIILRRIDPGSFSMGSPEGENGRHENEQQHDVEISSAFYIGVFEITQKQWELVMGTRPSTFYVNYTNRPVENVSYDMIRGKLQGALWPNAPAVDFYSFLGRLQLKSNWGHWDLPTEAQWEYACRAGSTTEYCNGDGWLSLTKVGRYWDNGGSGGASSEVNIVYPNVGTDKATAIVGSYSPNAWGLYDMHGNVWELTRDWYQDTIPDEFDGDPVGPSTGKYRVIKGGCWRNFAVGCRSAIRNGIFPTETNHRYGFRLFSDTVCSYTISFDANGGTGDMESIRGVHLGSDITLPSNAFSWDGMMFRGWSTTPDGPVVWNDCAFIEGGLCSPTFVSTADITLYARWSRGTYTVQFDPNGGLGTMSAAALYSDIPQALPDNAYFKEGMRFLGWATNGTDEVVFADGQMVYNLGDVGDTVFLHAIWVVPGLAIRYYDIASSGYSIWRQSESALIGYFADQTPSIETNSFDWGETLQSGLQNNPGAASAFSKVPGVWLDASSTNRYHAQYANQSQENFAVFLGGQVFIPTEGQYSFAVACDDEVVFYVDGTLVCSSSSASSSSGTIDLTTGMHRVFIAAYEKTGSQGLLALWKRPGDTDWSPLPQSILHRRTGSAVIEFDANGGIGEMENVIIDQNFGGVLPLCCFTNNGLTFEGWGEEAEGPAFLLDGSSALPPTRTGTVWYLYAIWSPWKYRIGDGQICISGVKTPHADDLMIPSSIIGMPVTSIDREAFAHDSTIVSITIPEGVISIASGAFADCTELQTISIPKSLKSISTGMFDTGAFQGCSKLKAVKISSLTAWVNIEFGHLDWTGVWGNCEPSNPLSFAHHLFLNGTEVTNIIFPNDVTHIGQLAFSGCTGITSITIPDSVTSIGDKAFYNCSYLATLSLPKRFEGNTSNMGIPSGCTVTFRE